MLRRTARPRVRPCTYSRCAGRPSQRARWLADKENAADLIGGAGVQKPDNTLASVLLDLTQSGQMRASEDAASQVLTG